MTALAAGLDGVLGVLGAALLHGTLLAMIALALSATVLRRARPGVIAALWTVVLLKFLVPVGPGARFSLASLVDSLRDGDTAAEPIVVTGPSALAVPTAPAAPPVAWGTLAVLGLWLAGASVVAARQLRAAGRARAQARQAAPAPDWLVGEVAALAARIGVRGAIEVRVAAGEATPYLVGFRAPIVVVPATALAGDRADARRAALAHELAHVRRGDAALRVVQVVAATAFFFWPVVRWVNRRLDLAREQACDAYAIAIGPLGAAAYARMLVEVARARLDAPTAALALARPGTLRRRVDALVAHPARTARPGLGRPGMALVGGWALVGLTGAASSAPPAATGPRVCLFTPDVATSIMAAHPAADADGDGALSHDEVCEYQLALRRRHGDDALTSPAQSDLALDASAAGPTLASALASEDLCCNCPDPAAGGATSTLAAADPVTVRSAIPTCVRGTDP